MIFLKLFPQPQKDSGSGANLCIMENLTSLLNQVEECVEVLKIGIKDFYTNNEDFSLIITLESVKLPNNKSFYLCKINSKTEENALLYFATFNEFLFDFEKCQADYFTSHLATSVSEFYQINRNAIFNYTPIFIHPENKETILAIFKKIYFLKGNNYQKTLNAEWFVCITEILFKDFDLALIDNSLKPIIDAEINFKLTLNKYLIIKSESENCNSLVIECKKIIQLDDTCYYEVFIYNAEHLLESLKFDVFDDFLDEFAYITKYLPVKLEVIKDKRKDIFNYECVTCDDEVKELLRGYFSEIDWRVGTEYQKICLISWFENLMKNE